jgi:hypothetical protein
VAVAICLTLESSLDVFFEVSDEELSMGFTRLDITTHYLGRRSNSPAVPNRGINLAQVAQDLPIRFKQPLFRHRTYSSGHPGQRSADSRFFS